MKVRTMLLAAAVILAPPTAIAQTSLPSCSKTAQGVPAHAAGLSSPFIWAFVNNSCTDLSSYLVAVTPGEIWGLDTPMLELGGGAIQLRATFGTDPFISFGATTIHLLPGPSTYAFLFGTPVVPANYNAATSTGGVTVTNGTRGNTRVTTSGVYPTYISGYGTLGITPTNLGVDLGSASCNASGTPLAVTTVCNQGTTASSFAPAFYDNLEVLLTYTQDDQASVASWSGAVTLTTTTPEPATIGLFGLGLVFVGRFATPRRTS